MTIHDKIRDSKTLVIPVGDHFEESTVVVLEAVTLRSSTIAIIPKNMVALTETPGFYLIEIVNHE